MNVLHLAAGNRWTGAAATAFAEAEALRDAGVNAHYAYVGGYKLEAKIGHYAWTHPIIEKAQNPLSFARGASAIRRLVARESIEVIHAHLTWDHLLAHASARGHARTARTFHSRRALRSDPVSRVLLAATRHLFIVNESFRDAPAMRTHSALFTPPPVDRRQFSPAGPDARNLHGLDAEAVVVAAIGKVTHDRRWEDVLRTFAALREKFSGVRLMIIGHGPHRPALEKLAADLGLAGDVTWAGYHEDDLADHYRAANLLLFTARGSDEGHRAVIEAQACGVPVATFPIEGVGALVGRRSVSPESSPSALAAVAAGLLGEDRAALQEEAVARAEEFAYPQAAAKLLAGYGGT